MHRFQNTSFYGGSRDGFLITIDNNLSIIDIKPLGTSSDDYISSIIFNNGNIIAGGASDHSGVTTLHPENRMGGSDLWITDFTTTVSVPEFKTKSLRIYPNPARNFINIEAKGEIEITELFSLSGRKIKSFGKIYSNQRLPLNDLKNGIYLLKITTSDEIITRKVEILGK